MNLRAFFFAGTALLIGTVAACTSSTGTDADCGAATCGACQDGFVNRDRCEDGEWQCECVPRPVDGGGADATSSGDADSTTLSCSQILASPTTGAKCAANAESPCQQGCLSCTCSSGTWGCTTNPSCLDAGGD